MGAAPHLNERIKINRCQIPAKFSNLNINSDKSVAIIPIIIGGNFVLGIEAGAAVLRPVDAQHCSPLQNRRFERHPGRLYACRQTLAPATRFCPHGPCAFPLLLPGGIIRRITTSALPCFYIRNNPFQKPCTDTFLPVK